MAFDWAQMRAMMIAVHGIRRADDKFAIFYDERNNIRKFALTDAGTNVEKHKNFVLGGIVLQEGQALPDIAPLREALGMQVNAPEIKFKHVASGDFEAALASRKMADFLTWLTEHRLAIHYSSINIVYWSIVDIVDSIIASKRFEAFSNARREVKNELYRIACLDKPVFLGLMRRHGYPSIQSGKAGAFIAEVDAFLGLHSPKATNLATKMLRELVHKAKALTELPFLEEDTPDVLIGSFSSFFTLPILLFENATHVFDREIQVERSLNADGFKQRAQGIDVRPIDQVVGGRRSPEGAPVHWKTALPQLHSLLALYL